MRLAKSKLAYEDGHLTRLNDDGSVAVRHPLHSVRSVSLRTRFSFSTLMVVIVVAGLGAIGWFFAPWTWLQWTSVILVEGFALIGLTGCFEHLLVVEIGSGSVEYPLLDDAANCKGFLLAIEADLGPGGHRKFNYDESSNEFR